MAAKRLARSANVMVLSFSPVDGDGGGETMLGEPRTADTRLSRAGEQYDAAHAVARFATFEALGGHRTSHKRPRVRADGLDLLLGARPGKAGAAAKDVHRCNTCGTVFPTGQALGGHMRRHRAAIFHVPALETTPTVTTSGLSEEEGDDDEDTIMPRTLIHFI
ncbi:hypothetical protein EJB05_54682, partial [Eragrostis curvula]